MNRRSRGFAAAATVRVISLIVLALQPAQQAAAQSTSSRPLPVFHGLFGPTEDEQTRPRKLDVNWSLYEAQDDNAFLATGTDILDSSLQPRRLYSGATISMLYTRRPPHRILTFSATSAGRYYSDLRRIVTTRYGGGMALDSTLTPSWRMQLSTDASFSPFYQVVLAPNAQAFSTEDALPPTSDNAVARQHAMQYGSALGLTRSYGARSMLAFNYGLRYSQVFEAPDSSSQRGGVSYTRLIANGIGLRLGYAYGVAVANAAPATATIRNQDIDIGLNYGRSFSPSKRTSLSFSSGSSIISMGEGAQWRLTGSARLTRRLAPRWSSAVLYDRGLQVPEGATHPFFSDTVAANVSGYFSRRANLRIQPSYSHGVVGLTGDTNSYNSYSATTRLEVGMTHRLALYAEHFYYWYQFASGAGLPPLLQSRVNRQGARVGLTLWTPLVQ